MPATAEYACRRRRRAGSAWRDRPPGCGRPPAPAAPAPSRRGSTACSRRRAASAAGSPPGGRQVRPPVLRPAAPLFLGPHRHHFALIRLTQFRRGGMVPGRRLFPRPGLSLELDQETCRVAGIHVRIESLLQRGERMRVVHQVDLHAADVDRAHSLGLQGLHRGHRLRLGLVHVVGALGVDAPWPRIGRPVRPTGARSRSGRSPPSGARESRPRARRLGLQPCIAARD